MQPLDDLSAKPEKGEDIRPPSRSGSKLKRRMPRYPFSILTSELPSSFVSLNA